MPRTKNSLLTTYDADFAAAGDVYGDRLESLTLVDKSQLIMAIGSWVEHCATVSEPDRQSFAEHVGMIMAFDNHDPASMVEDFLDFVEPLPAMQLAIALSHQILEGIYSLDDDLVYDGFREDNAA